MLLNYLYCKMLKINKEEELQQSSPGNPPSHHQKSPGEYSQTERNTFHGPERDARPETKVSLPLFSITYTLHTLRIPCSSLC